MSDKKYISLEADKIIEKLCFLINNRFLESEDVYIKVYNYEEENKKGYRLHINGIELEYYTPLNTEIIINVYKKLCEHFGGVYDEKNQCVRISNINLFREKVKKRLMKS